MKEVFCFVLYLECLARVFPAEVTLKHGKLTGKSRNIDGTQLFEFLGIPYAKAPTGDLRNLPPVSFDRWIGTLDASRWKPFCPQSNLGDKSRLISEDCLYLDVLTPLLTSGVVSSTDEILYGRSPYPVLVNFPSKELGGGDELAYFAAGQRVVVVTVHHRTGCLGYMCMGEAANLALADQQLALVWIKENIGQLGGDPNRVTLLGQGERGVDVNLHLLAPDSFSLYHRAWISSGSVFSHQAMQRNAIQQNKEFVTFVGCERDTRAEMLQCLREASLSNMTGYRGDWLPCTDGKIIQRNPAILYELGNWKHNADVVMGFSMLPQYQKNTASGEERKPDTLTESLLREELLEFLSTQFTKAKREDVVEKILQIYGDSVREMSNNWAPQQNIYEYILYESLSDLWTIAPQLRAADYHSSLPEGNGKVYIYEFADVSLSDSRYIAEAKGSDDTNTFTAGACYENAHTGGCAISKEMSSRLGSFVRRGDPNSHTTTHLWPRYSRQPGERVVFSIRSPSFSTGMRDYKKEKMDFWMELLFGSLNVTRTILPEPPASTNPHVTEDKKEKVESQTEHAPGEHEKTTPKQDKHEKTTPGPQEHDKTIPAPVDSKDDVQNAKDEL